MEVLNYMIAYFSSTLGLIELIGSIFTLLCVYYAAKHNIWTWFWGVLGVLCFGYIFWEVTFYFDAILQLAFYLPIQFVGLWVWMNKDTIQTEAVETFPTWYWVPIVLGIAILTYFSAGVLVSVGGAFPILDSIIVWSSVTAQIMLAWKYWQNWLLWVGIDVLAIYVYFMKGLFITSGLYAILLVIAAMGLWSWYNKSKLSTT